MHVTKVLGLAAVGAMLALAGAAASVQQDIKPATTEVRWWRHRHYRWHHRHHWRRW